jgi:excisionase family DNA binding protein
LRRDVPPEAANLIRPDGSIVIPAAVADSVLRLLVLGLTQAQHANAGGRPTIETVNVLHALNMAAIKDSEMSARGRDYSSSGTIEVSGEKLLTSRESALSLHCTERQVRRLCEQGKLPALKIGQHWLISETDLDTYRF